MTITFGSHNDALDWVVALQLFTPFLAAALVALFGLFVYRVQKRTDRAEKFHDEKREVYRDCLKSLSDLTSEAVLKNSEENPIFDADIMDAVFRDLALLTLYAPKPLDDAANAVLMSLINNNNDGGGIGPLAVKMRKDLDG